MEQYIYKGSDGVLKFSDYVETYLFESKSELSDAPESERAQIALVTNSGDGGSIHFRLPGGQWTEW